MALLRNSVIKSIYDELDNQYFSLSDFHVDFPKEGKKFASITFLHDTQYYFIITESYSRKTGIGVVAAMVDGTLVPTTVECPGNFRTVEENTYRTFEECIQRINSWCVNIRADLRAKLPALGDLEELQKQFEEHIKQHLHDPESLFSSAEIENIKKRFDDLLQKFEELEKKQELTEVQLNQIKKDFKIIKANAHEYPKGMWAQLTKGRMISLIRKVAASKEGRKLLYEGAKRALGWDAPTPL